MPVLLYMFSYEESILQLSYDICSCLVKLNESVLTSGFIHGRAEICDDRRLESLCECILRCSQHTMVAGEAHNIHVSDAVISEPLRHPRGTIRCCVALATTLS